jgi:hypothetical protein
MLKFADVAFCVGTRREVTCPKTIRVLFLNWEKIFLEILELDFFIFDLGFNS